MASLEPRVFPSHSKCPLSENADCQRGAVARRRGFAVGGTGRGPADAEQRSGSRLSQTSPMATISRHRLRTHVVPCPCRLQVVPLDWWPLTRDCLAYGVTVAFLICIIHDERVDWYEALMLVLLYTVYIAGDATHPSDLLMPRYDIF